MASILPPPQPLKLKNSKDANVSWKTFKQSWQLYEIASGSADKPDQVRVATFLHVAGPDAIEKYNGFSFQTAEDKMKIDKVIEKFDNDCKTTTNVLSERFKFYSRKQKPEETLDEYVTQLRILCSSCGFQNPDEALRDQFSLNIKDHRVKEKILDQAQIDHRQLTFEKAIAIAKTMESIATSKKAMSTDDDSLVLKIQSRTQNKNCSRCGRNHAYKKCPAFGKTCHKCNRENHFSNMCRVRNVPKVRAITFEDDSNQYEDVNEVNISENIVEESV